MRTALHYMLMSPLDDANQTIQLFGGWPGSWFIGFHFVKYGNMNTRWDVSFKLLGPLNTTVEASCVGGSSL